MNEDGSYELLRASEQELLRFREFLPRLIGSGCADEGIQELSETPDCPLAAEFFSLATGEISQDAAEGLVSHASLCLRCGQVLARTLAAFEGNPSAAEATAIQELAFRKEWRHAMAARLAATSVQKRPFFLSRRLPARRWMAIGAVAASVAMLATLGIWQKEMRSPEHQLAQAYTESRTMELRIPEGAFADLTVGQHTRGATADHEPPSLLDARAEIARELERSPQDARGLELQARADLLEERYDSAIEGLDRLIATGPVTAELLTDGAAAYYQRGLAAGSELDRSTALDYLHRADGLAPTDSVVLFNEAIVMEDRGQMMSAVEVWNRYITVERDEKWAAEGRRKLGDLEKTLKRLTSHQSRIDEMLSSPSEMNALAADVGRLKTLDEEISTYDLEPLVKLAYPVAPDLPRTQSNSLSRQTEQARGSPCADSCRAARNLLKAIADSLKTQHEDFWLSDLLLPDIDSFPIKSASTYAQAMNLLSRAIREGTTGSGATAGQLAADSGRLFGQLKVLESAEPIMRNAVRAGQERADFESLFAFQRQANYRGCRDYARQLDSRKNGASDDDRYPWIVAVRWMTMKVCDDTPETLQAGNQLLLSANALAEKHNYELLFARGRMRQAGDADNSGDNETAEHITLLTLKSLYASDPPIPRIAGTIDELPYVEEGSGRIYAREVYLAESLGWVKLMQNHGMEASVHMDLARAEIRLRQSKKAESEICEAQAASQAAAQQSGKQANFVESDILLANSYLENGNAAAALHSLDDAASHMSSYSDRWGLRKYASARGQLALTQGNLKQAANVLESEIRSNEGRSVPEALQADDAEYAQLDHDLYAELVATWLAEGRDPKSALALWERFLLRSRGLPIAHCDNGALDCGVAQLQAARHKLGDSLLVGQVVLLDRVLIYRMDQNGVRWEHRLEQRKDLLDSELSLARAVALPATTLEAASKLGKNLSAVLLPELPGTLDDHAALLLEPDPMLKDLPWPVLPTAAGALGLAYPIAEVRSIVAPAPNRYAADATADGTLKGRLKQRPLLVGASAASMNEPPLPEALAEVQSVDQFMDAPELLTGKQATTASIGEALGKATIFHFAGHAVQSKNGTELLVSPASAREASPFLDGAFLRAHRPRACRLAVLSACATGVHEAAWNHPLQDIVETLANLGVPEVVATRWQIDSEASVPFMNSFYRNLAQGDTVALALKSARKLQSGQSLYRNPYYWGAYYVSGRELTHLKGELHARL